MKYEDLVNKIESSSRRMTKANVVSFLIGYQGKVGKNDWKNIEKLYDDNFIDE